MTASSYYHVESPDLYTIMTSRMNPTLMDLRNFAKLGSYFGLKWLSLDYEFHWLRDENEEEEERWSEKSWGNHNENVMLLIGLDLRR